MIRRQFIPDFLRRPSVFLTVLIIVSALLALLRFNSVQVGAWTDDAHYVLMAQGLATGQGARLINYPDKPLEPNFNIGWPLMLMPIAVIFPFNYDVMKILPLILWMACIPLTYMLFARRLKPPYLQFLMILVALNSSLIVHSVMLMAESAYLFFSLLSLVLIEYWFKNSRKALSWLLVASALCGVFAWQMRTAGLAFFLALPAYLLLKRQFKPMITVTVIVVACFGLQLLHNSQTGRSLIYDTLESTIQRDTGDSFVQTKITQVIQNLLGYINEPIANTIVPIFGPNFTNFTTNLNLGFVPGLFNLGVLMLIGLGVIFMLRDLEVTEIYMIFYALALLTYWWPERNMGVFPRFLVPVIPFLYFYFIYTFAWLGDNSTKTLRKFLMPAFGVMLSGLVILVLIRNLQDWRNPARNQIPDLSIGATWLYENAQPDSIILTTEPKSRYLYTQRSTLDFPKTGQDLGEYILANNVTYILLAPDLAFSTPVSNHLNEYVSTYVLPYLETNAGRFELVFSDTVNNVSVYRVSPAI